VNLFYEILADSLVTIHLGYMAYVVLGQLAILIGWPLQWRWIRNPWFRVSHLAMILIVAAEAVVDYTCPLTKWERDLRIHIGQIKADPERGNVEEVSFVAQIMRSVLYAGSDEHFVPYLKPTYYTFAGLVLATVLLVPPRFRRAGAPPAERPPAAEPGTVAKLATAQSPEAPAARHSQ
jgi:Protein of Unknown function (DUF2784)